jgi:hypothetical protein
MQGGSEALRDVCEHTAGSYASRREGRLCDCVALCLAEIPGRH